MIDQVKQFAHEYGAITVFLLGAILTGLKYIFGARPKLIWQRDHTYFDYTVGKPPTKTSAVLQSLVIENVGRGMARNIEVIIPATEIFPVLERERAGWHLHNDTVLSPDPNFKKEETGDMTKLIIHSLEGRQLLKISYGSAKPSSHPTSITFDGKIAERTVLNYQYLNATQVLVRLLKSMWPVWGTVLVWVLLYLNFGR